MWHTTYRVDRSDPISSWSLMINLGDRLLIRCSVITTDPGLISAFVERWYRETSRFHLLVGEVTITLDDVSSLLHIPITGALHSFEPLATSDAVALLTELLESRCRARQWVAAAWTYLLHLVGCTLFANKSATHVHVVHLQAFRDLGQAGAFSWGVAALVHLYDQLNEASQAPTRHIAGYISLLRCWIYEHFPSVHRSVVDDGYAEASPRACRWLTGKAQMAEIKGAPYRARIDALTVTDVCWMPYAEHRGVRGYDLISSYTGQVRWDHVAPTGELCVVPGQVAPDYMEWFFQISHSFVTPTEDTAKSRPAPPPPTHDDDFVEPPVAEVPVASDAFCACVMMGRIVEHLERVINLKMVIAGTDLYDIIDLCLRITRDDDPDDSLRPRQRPRID
ncbi:Protein MAIN-LIKE 2 [Glycine max]|nr:Protein MAIN-LIKE 2 [Glycine max]